LLVALMSCFLADRDSFSCELFEATRSRDSLLLSAEKKPMAALGQELLATRRGGI
jgi:hypothetical protein